jgi:hypothetical protein
MSHETFHTWLWRFFGAGMVALIMAFLVGLFSILVKLAA